jgi:class I fructose-bisphosphate aldolase
MTTYGVAKHFGHLIAGKAALIVRLDGYNSRFGEKWMAYKHWQQLYNVEDVLRHGADAVIVNYFMGIEAESDSLRVMARSAADADKFGVPLVVEALACVSDAIPDHLDAEVIAVASRIATEHGADMIKCYFSGTPDFRRVAETNVAPVLIAGGPVTNTRLGALKMVRAALDASAKGVFFGQNIWRSSDPEGMTRALADIIHRNVEPTEAEKLYLQSPEVMD